MIRILNAEPLGYNEAARSVLREIGEVHEESVDRGRLLALLPDFDALIVRLGFQVDHEVIARGGRLRAVVSATTGLDHIDSALAERRGIAVLSLRGEYAFLSDIRATAEHTWALLLGLARHLTAANASVAEGLWDRDRFRGGELHGGTLGIIGCGRIGRQVAEYGRVFGMTVAAFDPYVDDLPPHVERCASLEDLLGRASVVSIHVPLNDETRGLIGASAFGGMRPDALLVNTARGPVVDSHALIDALASGRIAGAAVDVVDHESDPLESVLLDWYRRERPRNVIVTPHIGGATFRSMARTEVFMAEKLRRFFQHPAAVPARA